MPISPWNRHMGLFHSLRTRLSRLITTTYPWPALDVSLPGKRHLHLVGSIHMGTADMSPLSSRLLKKLRSADALIVEADIHSSASPVTHMPSEIPLEQRLNKEAWHQVLALCHDFGLSISSIDNQPAWQVALILQAYQAQHLGLQPEYGIDYQLLEVAHHYDIPVQELEGTQEQFDLLMTLPEGGMSLLNDTLTHWHTNARLLLMMISWWLEAPPRASKNIMLPNTFSHHLYDVLMHNRNRQWLSFLQQLPAGNYVVAVGALHLYGEGNLFELIQQT